jgi:hypothetical protein
VRRCRPCSAPCGPARWTRCVEKMPAWQRAARASLLGAGGGCACVGALTATTNSAPVARRCRTGRRATHAWPRPRPRPRRPPPSPTRGPPPPRPAASAPRPPCPSTWASPTWSSGPSCPAARRPWCCAAASPAATSPSSASPSRAPRTWPASAPSSRSCASCPTPRSAPCSPPTRCRRATCS